MITNFKIFESDAFTEDDITNIKPGDYVRYKNDKQDSIWKILETNNDYWIVEVYMLLPKKKYFDFNLNYNDLKRFIKNRNKYGGIFRLATEEEIDMFEIGKKVINYNL